MTVKKQTELVRADLETALRNTLAIERADDAADYSREWVRALTAAIRTALDLT